MRILILSQWFDPEPTFKGLQFAHALQALGHDVSVLTGFPNYPGGKLYPGYRIRVFQRETRDGVKVLRAPLFPSHDASVVGRALNYLSFAVSASIAILFVRRPDIIYVYHPPATVAAPAMVARLIRGIPFVYDIQDLWPDSLTATDMAARPGLIRAIGRFLDKAYSAAAHIVVLSPGLKTTLLERGVADGNVSVIFNWTYEPVATPACEPAEVDPTEPLTILYAGNMGMAQALDAVLDGAARLQALEVPVRFLFVGDGLLAGALKERSRRDGLANVAFLPRRTALEMDQLFATADVLLVHLRSDPLFAVTIPSKTQAYLRAGKPILMGVEGDASRLVEAAGAGITFAPETPASLVAAVTSIMRLSAEERRRMGQSGAAYYREHLSQAAGARRFAEVFERTKLSHPRGHRIKRAIDLVIAGTVAVVLAPPILIVAAMVAIRIGRPVLFRQQRPGRYGKPFNILKFRTMTDSRDAAGALLPDSQRLTPFGAWLRSTSLDELPALINVLKGEMSLVGPRPLLMRYTAFFTSEEKIRLLVRPGVTGWAQVNGRNLTSWDRRLALDVWYVRNWSLGLDLKTLVLTAWRVLRRQDVVVDAESIMRNLDDERRSGRKT